MDGLMVLIVTLNNFFSSIMTARLVCGGKSGQLLGTERCSTGTYLETITLEVVIRVRTHISCVRPVVRSGIRHVPLNH